MSKKAISIFLCIIFFVSRSVTYASTCLYEERPTTTHLLEAIHLNKARKQLYRQYFGPKVAKVFAEVMFYEHLMIPFAMILDLEAKPFLCAGVKILKDDLVSIEMTPNFSSTRIMPGSFEKPDDKQSVKNLKKGLHLAIKNDQTNKDVHFTETLTLLTNKLKDLQAGPHVNCLLRHFLESTALALTHADSYSSLASDLGLKSTLPLSIKFAKVHLRALSIMARLDRNAYPLQKEGIPIFCQDIPPITIDSQTSF